MRFGFTIFLSTANLRRHKLRSVLTIGGMAIGISLIVFLVSLGFGLQRMMINQIANVEALTILEVSKGESTLLELNDEVVDSFKNIDSVSDVSPSLSLSGQVTYQESVTDIAIYGIEPDFLSMEGVKVNFGELFQNSTAQEVLITQTALNLIGLGDPQEAVGKTLSLKVLVPQKIEGAVEEELVSKEIDITVKGVMIDDNELSLSYLPMGFLTNLGFQANYSEAKVKVGAEEDKDYSVAKVKVTDEANLPVVRQQIESMGYQVDSVADTVGQIDQIFIVFEIIVSAFGAIAMFVAALGSLNTLTVSLLERTREIGLLKSLGSTSGDVYRLFLVESIVIGLTGGIVGIILGILLGKGANAGINFLAGRLGGEPVELFYTPFIFILVIIGVVFFVSLVTGVYPARRAAKIKALDALRYE